MREEHPIDERFRALYDAEAAPPSEVRDALARQLGWDTGVEAGSTWRPWTMLLVGAALAVSSASQLLRPSLGSEEKTMAHHAPVAAPLSGIAGSATDTRAPAETYAATGATPNRMADPGAPGTDGPGAASATQRPTRAQEVNNVPTGTSGVAANDARTARFTAKRTNTTIPGVPALTIPNGAERSIAASKPTDMGSMSDGIAARHASVAARGAEDQALPDADAREMDILLTTLAAPEPGTPVQGDRPAPYVLANGQWWLGLYAGLGRSNGTWQGAYADALNTAERWRGSFQWGAQIGRSWRSGWSVSAGAGLELTQSTFTHEERSVAQVTEVDTTWTATVYNNTEDLVYTWNIDTLTTTRPSDVRRSSSRNRYGAIQMPLTLSWHGDLRRWRYGLLGGVVAYIPTQREGRTLVDDASDASVRVVDLSDASVGRRFGARMSAQFGLSLGYAVREHLAIYAEPLFFTPIPALTPTEAPRMSGYSFQIRLQHEFGRSPR
ncbi:MAG: hypothetical protein ACO1NQ_07950 [Flavobacteriales bacterium]